VLIVIQQAFALIYGDCGAWPAALLVAIYRNIPSYRSYDIEKPG